MLVPDRSTLLTALIIFAPILVFIGLATGGALEPPASIPDEVHQTRAIRDAFFPGGVLEHVLQDSTRVDLLLPDRAIEVDWAPKWAEGVGQAIYYGKMTGRQPTVLLLLKGPEDRHHIHKPLVCGVEVWAFDVVSKRWVSGRPAADAAFGKRSF